MSLDVESDRCVDVSSAFAPLTPDEEDRIVGSMVRERADLARTVACLEHRLDCGGRALSAAARAIERFCADEASLDLPPDDPRLAGPPLDVPALSYPSSGDLLAQAELLSDALERSRAVAERISSC